VVAGGVVLGHVAVAGLISILFIGWTLLLGGVVIGLSGLLNIKEPGHRSSLVVGVLLIVLGFGFVRNPGVGLLVLTLLAGSMLIVGGIVRIAAAFADGAPRGILLLNGGVTLGLGLLVMFQWPVSALWLLGTILGVQLILDGITMILVGRLRPVQVP
jgi:membrane protein HdeD